jgi:hypothetical protein
LGSEKQLARIDPTERSYDYLSCDILAGIQGFVKGFREAAVGVRLLELPFPQGWEARALSMG